MHLSTLESTMASTTGWVCSERRRRVGATERVLQRAISAFEEQRQ
jgi:hypothetical protein